MYIYQMNILVIEMIKRIYIFKLIDKSKWIISNLEIFYFFFLLIISLFIIYMYIKPNMRHSACWMLIIHKKNHILLTSSVLS